MRNQEKAKLLKTGKDVGIMTTTKLNPFDRFDNSDICHMQAVYLDAHGFAADEISTYTGYAISTVKTYIRKFGHLLDEAKALFIRISQRVKREIWGPRELAYLFKFYDKDNNLVCSKVGTTTRTIAIRLGEELKAYAKSHNEKIATIHHAKVCAVFDCGKYPAEGLESYTRAKYIQQWPDAFMKNDRFVDVDIPTQSFKMLARNYLGSEGKELPLPL